MIDTSFPELKLKSISFLKPENFNFKYTGIKNSNSQKNLCLVFLHAEMWEEVDTLLHLLIESHGNNLDVPSLDM